MIGMMTRLEAQVLLKAGHTQADVARRLKISERSVRAIGHEAAVAPESLLAAPPGRGRPSKVEAFRNRIAELLKEEPKLLSLEIVRRMRLQGYDGRKSAMYALIAALRPAETRPLVRFEGVAGEFAQHDFGHVDVRFRNGSVKRTHFFASRLKYSRDVRVTIVENEQVESLIRAQMEHYAAWGGVPLLSVYDRPKTIVLKWSKDGAVTDWNSTFAAVMLELGVGIELCWPARGQEKGSVENLVGWVKGSFFKVRRFWDDADLREQLAEWHVEVNTRRPCRATGVIPAERMIEERERLRPLKVAPGDLALRIPIYVGPTATVLHDTHVYSMDADAIGIAGTLYLYPNRVRIIAGKFSADHPRLWGRGERSILPEHRASMVAAVSGKRAKRYLKRQQLLDLGQAAYDYVTEIVHRRPRAWIGDVERLHALLQRHGAEAMRQAFQLGLAQNAFGAEYVAHFLDDRFGPRPIGEVAR